MTTSADDTEPLIINGRPVDRSLLEPRPLSRCRVEECHSWCCTGGVWLHLSQVDDILAHQHLIIPHMPADRRDPSQWFDGTNEPDTDWPAPAAQFPNATGTAVVPDPTHPAGQTCIFLNAERRCALQAAGLAAGEHPWRFKPFYCALHPLCYDEGRLVYVDSSAIVKEGGHCSRPSGNGARPLFEIYDWETRLALGDDGYAELAALAKGE